MKIGVDGGGTKTEFILVADDGLVMAHHQAGGCNPSVVGPDQAARTIREGLISLVRQTGVPIGPGGAIEQTVLCMAGAPGYWAEFAGALQGFGYVQAFDDSVPVLELATEGHPGLVLHSGTGSFVAARAPNGTMQYAGGLGWRLDDAGSGYDIGRRAMVRTLLELQGWALPSMLATAVRDFLQFTSKDPRELSRFYYQNPDPNRLTAALAPLVIRMASEGDEVSLHILTESLNGLMQLSEAVLTNLFAGWHLDSLRAAVSGHILTHPTVFPIIQKRSSLVLKPIRVPPIEGVRQLLMRI